MKYLTIFFLFSSILIADSLTIPIADSLTIIDGNFIQAYTGDTANNETALTWFIKFTDYGNLYVYRNDEEKNQLFKSIEIRKLTPKIRKYLLKDSTRFYNYIIENLIKVATDSDSTFNHIENITYIFNTDGKLTTMDKVKDESEFPFYWFGKKIEITIKFKVTL